MQAVFSGSFPKDLSFPDENEDSFATALERGRIALSDGASESFDSKTWSNLLVSHFIDQPSLDADWLREAISDYERHFDLASLSWSKHAAFNRGSFATLLAIEYSVSTISIEVLAVGDTLAVLLDDTEFVTSFPYVSANEFQQRPELLSTNADLNGFIEAPDFFLKRRTTWPINKLTKPVVLCMTDALGEWALRGSECGRPVWRDLSAVSNSLDFAVLVNSGRHFRNMRIDDSTLLRVALEIDSQNELSKS